MIWLILLSTTWSGVSGISEYHRMRDRTLYAQHNIEYQYHSDVWHKMEFVDASLAIGVGITIGLDAIDNESVWVAVSDMVLAGAIRWNVRDGAYNLMNGNSFYYRSPNTMSGVEQCGLPVVKLSVLAGAILLRILVED